MQLLLARISRELASGSYSIGMLQKTLVALAALIIGGALIYYLFDVEPKNTSSEVTSFEECAALGNPVMESYPRQCRTRNGELFVEHIGNELEKDDLIRLDSPRPNAVIESPLEISGEARGYWFFEASFPVYLTNWDGLIISQWHATATGEWMTENFVPFTSLLDFESPYKEGDPDFFQIGTLILQKDNPSGLSEHDDALEIPVLFSPSN